MTNKDLAELLYPNVKYDIDYLEKKYPERNLPEGALIIFANINMILN